ncbi:MAG: adenosylcobinamide-phosphate synthase CbiB [Nitrospirales bacterium]
MAVKVLAACGLDAMIGDPRWFPHPVRFMGMFTQWYEDVALQWIQGRIGRYVSGIILALGFPAFCYLSAEWVIQMLAEWHEWAGHAMWIFLGSTTLAARDLADHAHNVSRALQSGSLTEAREAVGAIVGRDTENLSESEIVRATIETVAESTSDGVVAPLFYLVIGGPPLALAYKAVNTLDSMIGHRTETYQYFGWASARCDDLWNWLPARLSGLCLVMSAALLRGTGMRAWNTLIRDGAKHASPNSGRPEAAMAGALQVQLGGVNYYDGHAVQGHLIGDEIYSCAHAHISLAIQLMIVASILAMILLTGLLLL